MVESAVMAPRPGARRQGGGDLKGGGNHCYVAALTAHGRDVYFYEYRRRTALRGWRRQQHRAYVDRERHDTLQPIEAVEQLYPCASIAQRCARIRRPGRWRGGLGLTREVSSRLPALSSRAREKSCCRPSACAAGARCDQSLLGAAQRSARRDVTTARQGERLSPRARRRPAHESSGGGGFGDPLERDPRASWPMSSKATSRRGGGDGLRRRAPRGAPDLAATRCVGRSSGLRASRACGARPTTRGVPSARYGTAARLGVQEGAVVELVNRGSAPGAWVAGSPPPSSADATSCAEVAPIALRMLAITDGRGGVRAVHSGALTANPA